MPIIRLALFLLVAGISAGCLRMTYSLNLKPDGSGTIVQTIGISKAAMAGATAALGEIFNAKDAAAGASGASGPIPFFEEKDLKVAVAAMGEGVRLVGVTPVSDAAIEGQTVTFAFDDIRKLKLDLKSMFAGLGEAALSDMHGADPIGIEFVREGGRSVLVLTMPEVDADMKEAAAAQKEAAAARKTDPATPVPTPDVPPEMKKMFEEMFKDFVIEMALNFEGTIIAADAPFVDGKKVTLMEMNFGEIMKNAKSAAELMQKLESMDPSNVEQMFAMPGLKIAAQRKLRIEFR